MKREYFIIELLKSGPFILLIVMVFLILFGVYMSNHRRGPVKMREEVMYISPNPGN